MTNKNIKFKKYRIPLISMALGIGGIFLFSSLTFFPNQAFADYDWETRKLADISTMQEMNAKICENSSVNDTKQLEDERDGKKYWVTKLADENCWMTQNLAYGTIDDASIGKPCTLSEGSCPGWIDSDTDKYFAVGSHTDADHFSKGNYYNWPAAVQNSVGGTGIQGICPSNWQLPTANNTDIGLKSFGGLIDTYSINNDGAALRAKPLYFIPSGFITNSRLVNTGNGYVWSSTPHESNTGIAYYLAFASDVIPSAHGDFHSGMPVRCVNAEVYPEEPLLGDDQANVSIKVSPVISIEVTKHATNMEVDFNKVARDSIVAKIGSNQAYQVLINTDQSNLEQTPIVENQNIPMIESDQPITAGTNSWGIKKLSSPTDTTVDENTIYSPVGTGDQKALFYTSTTAATESLTFPVAIAVSPTLPSGQYATKVTLTAVAN